MNEEIVPSSLKSYLAWNDSKLVEIPRDSTGVCMICQGFGEIDTPKYGRIRCACEIESIQAYLETTQKDFSSQIDSRDIAKFKEWGTPEAKRNLARLVSSLNQFMAKPDFWITILGGTGSGKTYSLSILHDRFKPWSFYITTSDLEFKLSEMLDNGEELSRFLNVVSTAPILLLDDLGAEYVRTGKDFVRAKLRQIIDYRYMRPLHFPTVVATNLTTDGLMTYDMRIGSRIMDRELVHMINLAGVADWRRS